MNAKLKNITDKKRLLLFLMFYFISIVVASSQTVLKGIVKDKETLEPLIGTSISIEGTTVGGLVDIGGNFEIRTNEQSGVIVASFIGYKTEKLSFEGSRTFTILMENQSQQLDEVVAVGYGVQKKSHLSGAIAKYENKDMAQTATSGTAEAISGRIAGVKIRSLDAQVGVEPVISVRGNTSINASSNPLVVVDGVPSPDGLSFLNPNDVESIEVLKDAASSSIYGSRGSNGVIIVTTKKGSSQEGFSIDYNSYFGFKQVYEKKHLIPSPTEWINFVESQTDEIVPEVEAMKLLGTETDWEDEMFQTGFMQNHTVSIQGRSNKVSYLISAGYVEEEGVVITNEFERFNFRANINAQLSDYVEVGADVAPSIRRSREIGIDLHDALRAETWLPVIHDEHTLSFVNTSQHSGLYPGDFSHSRHYDAISLSDGSVVNLSTSSNNNPYSRMTGTEIYRNGNNNQLSTFANIRFDDHFTFRTTLANYTRLETYEYFRASTAHRQDPPEAEYRTNSRRDWIVTNTLNYIQNFDKHALSGVLGQAYEDRKTVSSQIKANNFKTDYIHTLNAGTITSATTSEVETTLLSYFFRLNYAFDNKYLFSLSSRWDGSSRFGENNKWGFFPAFSAAWRITEEDFLNDNSTLNDLKLRASVGVTGNEGASAYAAYGLISSNEYILGNNDVNQGFYPSSIANPDLGWERTIEYNVGTDAGFLNNNVIASVDFYHSQTDDLLLEKELQSATGFTNSWVNAGAVQNMGVELVLNTRNINNKDFRWATDFNIAHNKNKVVDLGGPDQIISTVSDSKRPTQFIAKVGEPLVQFYGYRVEEEIPHEDLNNPYYPINVSATDVYVKDLNGDGVITEDDREVLGSPYPDFTWGLSNTFAYKNIDFSFTFEGSHGGEVYNADKEYYEVQWRGGATLTPEEQSRTKHKTVTDLFIEDASYIALRTISLGYNISNVSFIQRLDAIKYARVYMSAYNLLYFTFNNYSSYNPEAINRELNNPYTYGYQRGAAPIATTIVFGLNIKF